MKSLLLTICLALPVTACATVGPDSVPPRTFEPIDIADTGDIDFIPMTRVDWWRGFQDATLDDLVERAFADSLDVQIAIARWDEARALSRGARANLLPQIGGGVTAGQERSSANAPGNIFDAPPSTSRSFQAGFDANWEIDLFGGKQRALQAQLAGQEAQRGVVDATQVTIAAEIARLYITLRSLQARYDVAQNGVDNAARVLDLTQRLRESGVALTADVQRAQADLAARSANLPAFEGEIERATNQLAVLIGQVPGSLSQLIETSGELPIYKDSLAIAFPAAALRARPDVFAAEQELRAATAEIGSVTAELYPKIVLPGGGGVFSALSSDLLQGDSLVWSFAPQITMNLFDAGRVNAEIEASKARARQAFLRFDQTNLNALLEISDGLSLRRTALAQAQQLGIANASAQAAADALDKRYQAGAERLLTVLDARDAQLEAADAAIVARAEAELALISLFKATAGAPLEPGAYPSFDFPEDLQ